MYAIIETGGKQYNVKPGDRIYVEKLEANPGDSVSFDSVLFISGEGEPQIGTPYISGASVTASVLEQGKEKKVVVFKYKPKKSFQKKKGHRQPFTSVRIEAING